MGGDGNGAFALNAALYRAADMEPPREYSLPSCSRFATFVHEPCAFSHDRMLGVVYPALSILDCV